MGGEIIMNKVILIGNLTKNPELSQTSGGIAFCRMSIAVNRPYANADGERQADFFNVTCWRGLAENCNKFLSKGKKIAVSGRIEIRSYEQDGVKKYATDIIAEDVEFLSPKLESESKTNNKNTPQIEDDDLPF